MRFRIKKWGNGIAIRLPRSSPELGRLEVGMEVDAAFRPVKQATTWRPLVLRSPIRDPSQHIDEIRQGRYDEVLLKQVRRGHRRH